MRKIVRPIIQGAIIGLTTAGLLTSPSWLPAALAAENVSGILASSVRQLMAPNYDPDSLVHYEGRDYSVTYDDGAVAEPSITYRIKKVEYGNVSYVDVAVGPSGMYSSEALFSPNVTYTGIVVTALAGTADPFTISRWSRDGGWTPTESTVY